MTLLNIFIVHKLIIFVMFWSDSDFTFICYCSDSPHSEPGTIDEADNGTEPHTSDEGLYIILLLLWCVLVIPAAQYWG